MKKLFFPSGSRITRRQFWMAQLGSLVASSLMGLVGFVLGRMTNQSNDPGQFSADGAAAVPMIVFSIVALGVSLALLASAIVVAIKRFHDRDKSGAWVFIVFIPLVGIVWYLIEVGFLAGTPGPNRFGPAPRPGLAQRPDQAFSVAR